MAGKYQFDDFDDFFDTHRSVDKDADYKPEAGNDVNELHSLDQAGFSQSANTRGQNTNTVRGASGGEAIASDTDSDRRFDSQKFDRAKLQSRSSSKSGGSYSSDDSYSSTEHRSRVLSRQSRDNISLSRSSSAESRSKSGSDSPDSTAYIDGRKEGGSKCRHSKAYSDRFSDSGSPTFDSDPDASGQAWKVEIKSKKEVRGESPKEDFKADERLKDVQPKDSRLGLDSNDRPSKHRRGKSNGRDSDSDMTDVSPISSPRQESRCSAKPPTPQILKGVDKPGRTVADGGDCDSLDLNILLKAVKEMEKQSRIQANSRKVMFEPPGAKRTEKANYTFSSDDTRRIDQENERLLHKIMHRMHQEKPQMQSMQVRKQKIKQPTPSAVNRRRDHQRIESENLAFLKRLNSIKPSRGISRQEQLSAYNTTVLHGVPVSALHATSTPAKEKRRPKSAASSEAGSLARTRSLSSVHSAATTVSLASTATSSQSRRTGSRPSSAKKSVKERPPWDDRW